MKRPAWSARSSLPTRTSISRAPRWTRSNVDPRRRVDFRPFIIADADTGHGGDAHVRNLVRRFVEVGVPGYHIEDQKPGRQEMRPPGRQGPGRPGRAEQAAQCRPLAARHHAGPGHHRRPDRCRGRDVPRQPHRRARPAVHPRGDEPRSCRATASASWRSSKTLHELGSGRDPRPPPVRGARTPSCGEPGLAGPGRARCRSSSGTPARRARGETGTALDGLLDAIDTRYAEVWQAEAGLKTYGEAVADVIERRTGEGERFDMILEDVAGLRAAGRPSPRSARRPRSLGIRVAWDPELPKTPEGYYQVQGGIDYAIAKSLAAAPFADLLWMETKTADLEDARRFADGDPRRVSRTRCWRTTCRHRSTGTRPG